MSGYEGQPKEKPTIVDYKKSPYKNIGVLSAKLLNEDIKDPSSEKRVV